MCKRRAQSRLQANAQLIEGVIYACWINTSRIHTVLLHAASVSGHTSSHHCRSDVRHLRDAQHSESAHVLWLNMCTLTLITGAAGPAWPSSLTLGLGSASSRTTHVPALWNCPFGTVPIEFEAALGSVQVVAGHCTSCVGPCGGV